MFDIESLSTCDVNIDVTLSSYFIVSDSLYSVGTQWHMLQSVRIYALLSIIMTIKDSLPI